MNRWNDGHYHRFVYFGGMASCSLCAASVNPDGKVKAPTSSSRQHRQMAIISAENNARKKR